MLCRRLCNSVRSISVVSCALLFVLLMMTCACRPDTWSIPLVGIFFRYTVGAVLYTVLVFCCDPGRDAMRVQGDANDFLWWRMRRGSSLRISMFRPGTVLSRKHSHLFNSPLKLTKGIKLKVSSPRLGNDD